MLSHIMREGRAKRPNEARNAAIKGATTLARRFMVRLHVGEGTLDCPLTPKTIPGVCLGVKQKKHDHQRCTAMGVMLILKLYAAVVCCGARAARQKIIPTIAFNIERNSMQLETFILKLKQDQRDPPQH